jgi:hypothetical protein
MITGFVINVVHGVHDAKGNLPYRLRTLWFAKHNHNGRKDIRQDTIRVQAMPTASAILGCGIDEGRSKHLNTLSYIIIYIEVT